MTTGERILNAVDQETAITGLSNAELVALVDELSGRTWWNDFWVTIAQLTTEETVHRFCQAEKNSQIQTPTES